MLDVTLDLLDPRQADDLALAELWAFREVIRAERMPDDPPLLRESFVARTRNIPDFYHYEYQLMRAPGESEIVAACGFGYELTGENMHLAEADVEVLPGYRRRGLGRRLLGWAAAAAQAKGRRLLLGHSSDRVPAGAAFARAVGATPGLEERHSQLVLAELDRGMLRDWQEQAFERAPGYELIFWDNEYPEELIEPFAALCQVMNTAPRGDLEVEDFTITPEQLREYRRRRIAAGRFAWTMLAREQATGALAGYSELMFDRSRPTIVSQAATGVRPEHRGRGLGRWLKAAMLERLLAEHPEARLVRTDNAETNASMLAINVALGFQPYMTVTIWQVEVERALAFADRV
jgi:GNAT superfamily N-acetyltransferase